jgi:hypothetical protein
MNRLFRAAKEDVHGMPEVGPSARGMGVRPGIDVPATQPDDVVYPGQGGLSVSPDDPLNLPPFRRPPEFQGTGRDPVWGIGDVDLGGDLCYRPDPANPAGHGFIEPVRPVTLAEYQEALTRLQGSWQKEQPGSP